MTISPSRAVLAFCLLLAAPGRAADVPLRVSMVPTTDPSRMLRDAEPLVARLEKATGQKVSLTIPRNYAAVVEALVQGQVDLAHLGGFTFVQANRRAGAIPVVQREKVRVFWTTPPFCDEVWVVRKSLDLALTRKLAEAFLSLDPEKAEDRPILDVLSAKSRYVAVDASAYARLRDAARREGLLE